MVNQELLNHIKQQLQQGKKRAEIEEELLRIGWQGKAIEEAFNTLGPLGPPAVTQPSSFSPSASSWEAIGQQKLHPNAVWTFFYRSLLKGVCLAAVIEFFLLVILTSAASFLLFVFLAGFGVAYLWARLSYRAYRYELTQYGFYKESGVIRKKQVVLPYEKMHKVDIYRGILERILGLSGLRIQIAGRYGPRRRRGLFGQSWAISFSSFERFRLLAEEELPGLSLEVAEQLNTELLVRRATSTQSGV